ncbi:hypothetical protein Tco_1228300, partial [Tanacetum coccineum]
LAFAAICKNGGVTKVVDEDEGEDEVAEEDEVDDEDEWP